MCRIAVSLGSLSLSIYGCLIVIYLQYRSFCIISQSGIFPYFLAQLPVIISRCTPIYI